MKHLPLQVICALFVCSLFGCNPNNRGFCGDGVINVRDGIREECDIGGACAGDINNQCTADQDCGPLGPCVAAPGGCHESCQLEGCGDGVIGTFEVCDNGMQCTDGRSCTSNNECASGDRLCRPRNSDGCDDLCQTETCGDGSLALPLGESCDDGMHCNDGSSCTSNSDCAEGDICRTRDLDGCSRFCTLENCGDGVLDDGVAFCDDGNVLSGDGCSFACAIELGFTCTGEPSVCTASSLCGDGAVIAPETCDNGKECIEGIPCTSNNDCANIGDQLCLARSGDGCDGSCAVEPGFSCSGAPSVCILPQCGDSNLDTGEGCDDGNANEADGCRANCSVVSGFSCAGEPSVCSASSTCGDFIVQGGETCDRGTQCDGSAQSCTNDQECTGLGDGLCVPRPNNDGCDEFCQIELCGNSITDAGEACDNGKRCSDGLSCAVNANCFNTQDGLCLPRNNDGCDVNCQIELCGNSNVDNGEVCDNGRQCSNGTPCANDSDCFFPSDGTCLPRNNDGCADTCAVIESGFICVGSPSTCVGQDCFPVLNAVPNAQLQFCPLVGQSLAGLNLSGANLSNANLSNVDLSNAILTNANFTNTLFNGLTNFSNADLTGATGQPRNAGQAQYSNTLCPNGANSSTVGGSCVGQGF